jgi:hypothetical protein
VARAFAHAGVYGAPACRQLADRSNHKCHQPGGYDLPQAFLHIVARFLLEEEPLLAYI